MGLSFYLKGSWDLRVLYFGFCSIGFGGGHALVLVFCIRALGFSDCALRILMDFPHFASD